MAQRHRQAPKHQRQSKKKRHQAVDEQDVGQQRDDKKADSCIPPHRQQQRTKGKHIAREVGAHQHHVRERDSDHVGKRAAQQII